MLQSEFLEAWAAQRESAKNWACSPPATLTPHAVDYIMSFYMREEFDAMCSGPDRHARFVEWAAKNYGTLSRDIEAAYEQMRHGLRVKAMAKEVRV